MNVLILDRAEQQPPTASAVASFTAVGKRGSRRPGFQPPHPVQTLPFGMWISI